LSRPEITGRAAGVPRTPEQPRVTTIARITEPPRVPVETRITETPRVPITPRVPRTPRVPFETRIPTTTRIPPTSTEIPPPTDFPPPIVPPPPPGVPPPTLIIPFEPKPSDVEGGLFPEVVGWSTGATDHTVNLQTGNRRWYGDLPEIPEAGMPESFTVVQRGPFVPVPQDFQMGLMRVNINSRRATFRKTRKGKRRPATSNKRSSEVPKYFAR
jgi:hypothetical protein